ncbi:MAG: hypothetical protein ACREH8_05020 [Opitutaceae bacterium]
MSTGHRALKAGRFPGLAELEVGTADVNAWYAAREGKMPLHYAVSVGHIPLRFIQKPGSQGLSVHVTQQFPGFLASA